MYIFSDPQAKKFTRHERWHSAVIRAPYDLSKKHYVVSPPGGEDINLPSSWTIMACRNILEGHRDSTPRK